MLSPIRPAPTKSRHWVVLVTIGEQAPWAVSRCILRHHWPVTGIAFARQMIDALMCEECMLSQLCTGNDASRWWRENLRPGVPPIKLRW